MEQLIYQEYSLESNRYKFHTQVFNNQKDNQQQQQQQQPDQLNQRANQTIVNKTEIYSRKSKDWQQTASTVNKKTSKSYWIEQKPVFHKRILKNKAVHNPQINITFTDSSKNKAAISPISALLFIASPTIPLQQDKLLPSQSPNSLKISQEQSSHFNQTQQSNSLIKTTLYANGLINPLQSSSHSTSIFHQPHQIDKKQQHQPQPICGQPRQHTRLLPVLTATSNFAFPVPRLQPNQPASKKDFEEEIENLSFEEKLYRIAQENEERLNQEFIRQQREAAHARQANLIKQIKQFYSADKNQKKFRSEEMKENTRNQAFSTMKHQDNQTQPVVPKHVIEMINLISSDSSESQVAVCEPLVIESDISVESTLPVSTHESELYQLGYPLYSVKTHKQCVTELLFFGSAGDLASIAGIGKELSVVCSDTSSASPPLRNFSLDIANETVQQLSASNNKLFTIASQTFLLIFEKTADISQDNGLLLREVLPTNHILSIESYEYIQSQNVIITAGQRELHYWAHNPITQKMENLWLIPLQTNDPILLTHDATSSELLCSTNSHIIAFKNISNHGIEEKKDWQIPIRSSNSLTQLESMKVIHIKHDERVLVTTTKSETNGTISLYKLPSTQVSDQFLTDSPIKAWKYSPKLCCFIILCTEIVKSRRNQSQILFLNHHLKPLRNLITLETQFATLCLKTNSLITSLELYTSSSKDEHEKISLGYENGLIQIFPLVGFI